jgi:hypothetical protein
MTNKKIKSSGENFSLDGSASVFSTHDIGVSTALLCAGSELLDVEKSNPRKAIFVFRKQVDTEEIVNKYFSDRLEVRARSFFDNLKALKNKLYN